MRRGSVSNELRVDRDTEKDMKKKITVLALCAMLFALCSFADGAAAGKVPRIGFLDNSTASGSAVLLEAFRQELASLDGLRERISPSSIGLPSKSLSAYLSLRRTWFVLRLI